MSNLEFYDAFASTYADYYKGSSPKETVGTWCEILRSLGAWPTAPAPRLLDLGCGPGAHLAPWAERGFRVEGLDGSPRMLALARRVSCADQLKVTTLYCADVRDGMSLAPLRERYDLIVAHFNFLNLFPHGELAKVLSGVAALLKPEGLFATDVTFWTPAGEVIPKEKSTFGADATGYLGEHGEIGITVNGRRVERHWRHLGADLVETLCAYSMEEIARAAAAGGLAIGKVAPYHDNRDSDLSALPSSMVSRLIVMKAK